MPPQSPFPAYIQTPHDLYKSKRDFQRPTVLRCACFTLPPSSHAADASRSRYSILGFLSSGTYGRVYKARVRQHTSDASPAGLLGTPSAATPGKRLKLSRDEGDDEGELVAIKKFKPDKEGEVVTYTGISQSACREIMVGLPSPLPPSPLTRLPSDQLRDLARERYGSARGYARGEEYLPRL